MDTVQPAPYPQEDEAMKAEMAGISLRPHLV
jgi:hypothetical protein